MKKCLVFIVCAVILVCMAYIVGCGTVSNSSGKPTDSGIDNKIFGFLYDTCGNPANNGSVIMRPKDYLKNVEIKNYHLQRDVYTGNIYTAQTDSNGVYCFYDVADGIYCIEAWSENMECCILIDSIVVTSGNLLPGCFMRIPNEQVKTDAILRLPSVLIGKLKSDPADNLTIRYIRVFGLEIYARVDEMGNYTLADLPKGNFTLQVVTIKSKFISYDTICASITKTGRYILIDNLIREIPGEFNSEVGRLFTDDGGQLIAKNINGNGYLIKSTQNKENVEKIFKGQVIITIAMNPEDITLSVLNANNKIETIKLNRNGET